jgi:hypothetical protein
MNTAPSAMTSQSQRLKPSSTPSATVRAMIKVKAAIVPQLLTRECDSATSSFPSVDPVRGFYSPPSCGGAITVAREGDPPQTGPKKSVGRVLDRFSGSSSAPGGTRRVDDRLTCAGRFGNGDRDSSGSGLRRGRIGQRGVDRGVRPLEHVSLADDLVRDMRAALSRVLPLWHHSKTKCAAARLVQTDARRRRLPKISRAALRPGVPITPPPGWAAAPHR